MTVAHEEKETLSVEVNIPAHADRVTTAIFSRTRKELIARDGVCYICGSLNSKESPLEAHHYPIERSIAELIDWGLVKSDAIAELLGNSDAQREAAKAFDWDAMQDHYDFVDNMNVNGMLLCKTHHIRKDEGIHAMPHPLWIAQRYALEGQKFSDVEIIHHQEHDEPSEISLNGKAG